MGQKFGAPWWLRFKVSHKVIVKLSRGAAVSSEGLTEGGSASKLTHVVLGRSWLFLGCWTEASVPTWLLLIGLPQFHVDLSFGSL